MAVTSDENATTYQEIISALECSFNFLMADGAKAITNGKLNAQRPNENEIIHLDGDVEVDPERGMCYPHVHRNLKAKLNGIEKNYVQEILDDVATVQLAQSRKEFDLANKMLFFKWLSLDHQKINEFIGY